MNEIIICAAIQLAETKNVFLGHRHNHCFAALNDELSYTLNRQEIAKIRKIQGFITSKNRFVNREEAAKIAFEANQIKKEIYCLFSEDLY